MSITIDYGNTNIINVELSDLTLVSGTLYTFDTNSFRLTLKDIEDNELGQAFPATHNHNTEVVVAGTTFARSIEILPPYSVQFPDQQISVQLIGSNNNIFDVESGILVQNQAQVIPSNSAGLIVSDEIEFTGDLVARCPADLAMTLKQNVINISARQNKMRASIDGSLTMKAEQNAMKASTKGTLRIRHAC